MNLIFKINKIFFYAFIFFSTPNLLLSKNEDRIILLYAPISMSEAIKEITASYEKFKKDVKVKLVIMGTSQLVMQIKNGAEPDIFISANEAWMDYLENKNMILKKYRYNYVYNSLVVITSKKNNLKKINNVIELKKVLLNSKTKLSLAMTNSIPAGIYAKSYLKNIGIWEKVSKNYVESNNVRAALNFVARNDLEFGIVYKTEAIVNNKVKVVYYIKESKHRRITYPLAALNNKKLTIDLYDYLLKQKNLSKYLKWGFEILK